MRRAPILLIAAFGWAAAPAGAAGQAPAARQRLATFDGQLAALTDSAGVRARERQIERRESGDSLQQLQRVLALLALNRLGDPWAARQAVGQAREATERHPDWPMAWYLLGRSLMAEGKRMEADPLELGRRVGFGRFEGAVEAFHQAVSLEPDFVPGLLGLEQAVSATRDTARITGMLLPALRSAREAGVAEPVFLLYLGRTERGFGSDQRARDAFSDYLAAGGNRGIGLREMAWALFALGDSSAASDYYDGAREDDSASVAAYRGDLWLITSDAVLAGFDSTAGEARVAWLRQFWEDRDREAMRSPGERLAEHFRRMTYSERHYVAQANRRLDSASLYWSGIYNFGGGSQFRDWEQWVERRAGSNIRAAALPSEERAQEQKARAPGAVPPELASQAIQAGAERVYEDSPRPQEQFDSTRFDQRGLVYVRQGEPDTIIQTVAWGVERNQTWQYRRADGNLMLHFGNVPEDMRFRTSLARIRTDTDGGAAPARWFLYNDRCVIYPQYCKMMVWGPYGRRKLQDQEERVVLASIAVATHTDAYELSFSHDLPFEAEAFAVGRAGAGGLVHLAWRFRPGPLATGAPGEVVPVATRVRAVLLDTLGHAVSWRDTMLVVRVPAGDPMVAQVGRLGMAAPPGAYTWRVALSVGDSIGGIPPRGSVEVPRFTAGTVTVSDLLLAAPGEGAPWIRPGGDTAYVTPRATWFRGTPLTLYHEIYGLREGEPYTSSLALKRGRKAVLTDRYDGIGSSDVTRVYRTLSLQGVSPGDYVVEIAVKGETGPWARSARSITVLKGK